MSIYLRENNLNLSAGIYEYTVLNVLRTIIRMYDFMEF